MSSKEEMNREIQALVTRLGQLTHERNGFAASLAAMATQLGRQEKAHQEVVLSLEGRLARLQGRLAALRWPWWRRAWTRIRSAFCGKRICSCTPTLESRV